MKIVIEDQLEKVPIKLDKIVLRLLVVVPESHYVQLEKIVVCKSTFDKKCRDAEGCYVPKSEKENAYIVLFFDNIVGGLPMIFFRFFPFFLYSFMADVLFHEIAHHYQLLNHGYKKKSIETHAEKYSLEMKKKYYDSMWTGKLLNYLRKIKQKMVSARSRKNSGDTILNSK